MKNDNKSRYSFKQRFSYWFDTKMSKGSLSFIRILIIASILLAIVMGGLIILFHFNEEGEVASVFWDSISTVINAWMPSFEDGSIGYVIIMALTAIAGVLFTSVLIGIITSAIEEKIIELKKGNSAVLEDDHIIVLGFTPGEYTLIEQLILSSEGKPICIVLAEDIERDELEQQLKENLDIPDNVRIICRSADITDPASIEKLSFETCQTVIVSPGEDNKVIKTILAVVVLMQRNGINDKRINAIVARNTHRFPTTVAKAHNLTTLRTYDIIAKMLAHSCTQVGLADTFRDIFNFDGCEFRIVDIPEMYDKTFGELVYSITDAIPAGIVRDEETILNPKADFKIQVGDRFLVFSEKSDDHKLSDNDFYYHKKSKSIKLLNAEERIEVLIIGYNETLPTVLKELPENVSKAILINSYIPKNEKAPLSKLAEKRKLKLIYSDEDPRREESLLKLAKKAQHIMILSDHDKDAEAADMDTIFLLLNFRDIRNIYDYDFNITVEMQKEQSQHLVDFLDSTDFLVSSSMSSLVLAQTAKNPDLISIFKELLSNKGNELYLKNVGSANLSGKHLVSDLRYLLLKNGYILLGIVDKNKNSSFLLDTTNEIELKATDSLIALGKG